MFKILISIIFTAAAVMIFFTKTKADFAEVKILREKLASYDGAMEQAKKIKDTVNQLLQQYNAMPADDAERVRKAVPSTAESMAFVVMMDNIASRNSLAMKNIEIKEPTSDVGFGDTTGGGGSRVAETMPFSVRLSGSYESFYRFLKDLEKSLRIVDVSSVKLSSASSGSFDFSVEGSAYWNGSEPR